MSRATTTSRQHGRVPATESAARAALCIDVVLEYAVVDPRTLRRLVGVSATGVELESGDEPTGGPQLAAQLVERGLRLTGDNCDQVVPLPR